MKLAISRTVTQVIDIPGLLSDIRRDITDPRLENTTDENVLLLCSVAEELMKLAQRQEREGAR